MLEISDNAVKLASIASSGFMGLAAAFIILALTRENPPARPLWAGVVVIALGMFVQLGSKLIDTMVAARAHISVSLSPDPTSFPLYIPVGAGDQIEAKPVLWLGHGKSKCNPHSSDYDPKATDCPVFAQAIELDDPQEAIYVSVENAMAELHDRLLRAQAVQSASASGQLAAALATHTPGLSPVGDDTPH